jgi:hypothetical protein
VHSRCGHLCASYMRALMTMQDVIPRECAFIATLSAITPSSISWGDRVDEDRLTHSTGITRRSCLEAHMVLDMEYREQELPEHGPGGPFFSFSARFVLPAVPASITTGLGLYQRGLLLHEVIGPRYHGMCHI